MIKMGRDMCVTSLQGIREKEVFSVGSNHSQTRTCTIAFISPSGGQTV